MNKGKPLSFIRVYYASIKNRLCLAKKEPLNSKDFLKIVAIAGIVIVPLIIGLYAVQLEEQRHPSFWSNWSCKKLQDFENNNEYRKLDSIQKDKFTEDLKNCNK